MKYKVLSSSPSYGFYVAEPTKYLEGHGCTVELVPQGTKLTEKELMDIGGKYDALITGYDNLNKAVISAFSRLRVLAKHGAGLDNIDVKAATEKGIAVISAPGANADAVADLTLGLILSLAREIPRSDRAVKEGKWPRLVGCQVNGKTLGIIGLGLIGKKVAQRAAGFCMKLLGFDVMQDAEFARQMNLTYLPLTELLAQADYVTIHVPLIPATRNLIGPKELALMKKDAFLVNIARGGIVDEEALYQALGEGRLRGAALDVFAAEPPKGNLLLTLENVIATPHMGGYTYEALIETGMICARGIVDFLAGRRPETISNPEIMG